MKATGKEWNVLLVEDDDGRRLKLQKALRARLGRQFGVVELPAGAKGDKRAYEDRLIETLSKGNIALVVSDRDLSRLDTFPGMSEAPVARVARELHIPVCVYASGKPDSFLERLRSGGGDRIIVDASDAAALARRVSVLVLGFQQFRAFVRGISGSKRARSKYRGPATVLAELLNAPEVVDHLALYSRGDQRMIAELVEETSAEAQSRSVALALGMWLHESILRFPGVILDVVAAGSFLGIDPKALRRAEICKVFSQAIYSGPFADSEEPRWWRHRLGDLLQRHGASGGRELATDADGKGPPVCRCAVDRRAPAGFMCVMTGEPVCAEHSVSGIGWLPRGADLARVRSDVFERVGPWIGMV